jgi:hypothetical protein
MVAAVSPPPTPTPEHEASPPVSVEETTSSADLPANGNEPVADRKPYASTAREMGIYENVHPLAKEGLSAHKIGPATGLSKETVR